MIGKLKGIVDTVENDHVLLDVGGVGYVVHASARTLHALPGPGEAVSLTVETTMNENQIRLYGFIDTAERDWFRLLDTVQGVGAKACLSILSVLPPDALASAIASEDKKAITAASGVGPKLAGRIVSELKDKVQTLSALAPVPRRGAAPDAEALSALINLGYTRAEAMRAVQRAREEVGDDADTGAVIKSALREAMA